MATFTITLRTRDGGDGIRSLRAALGSSGGRQERAPDLGHDRYRQGLGSQSGPGRAISADSAIKKVIPDAPHSQVRGVLFSAAGNGHETRCRAAPAAAGCHWGSPILEFANGLAA